MSSEETLRRLRADLDEVIARTEEISRRLKEMDELDGAAARVCEEVAPAADSQGEVPPLEQETPPAEPVRIMPLPFPAQPAEAPDRGAVPENSLWRTIAGHPAGRFLRGRAEEMRQRTRELGWEVLLGTYMLPRVAVACIAIAVVFFLTLAIERWGAHWMPHLRVGIGYAVSAGLLWLGWRSEKKFAGLARVLYGGGFAVMYFVTFATHYVRYAQVFQSAVPTLLLLVALVATWAVVAQIRQSKIIAALVTGLGHLTVLLSVLTLDPPGPFPILGIVVLSAGSAFFLLRNHWYHVAALGLAGSYLNDFVALGHGRTGDPKLDFTGAMGALVLFFLIFALAELFSPEGLRRRGVPVWFRNVFVAANTFAFYSLGAVVFGHFTFTAERLYLFQFSLGAALMLIGLGYKLWRADDPLYNIYFLKSLSFVTLSLATRFSGDALSACLAVETVALLISAWRSRLIVVRIFAFGVAGLAFVQSLNTAFLTAFGADLSALFDGARLILTTVPYDSPEYAAGAARALIGVAAFLSCSLLYQRIHWRLISPASAPFKPQTNLLLWQLDLVSEPPASESEAKKTLNGLLFPLAYALAGTSLFFAYLFPLLQEAHRFPAIAGFVLALTACAVLLDSQSYALGSAVSLLLGALPLGMHHLGHFRGEFLAVNVVCLVMLFISSAMSEASRARNWDTLLFRGVFLFAPLSYGVFAWLAGLFLAGEFSGVNGAFALAAAAALAIPLSRVLHPGAFTAIAGGYILWASVIYVPEVTRHFQDAPGRFGAAAGLLAVLSLLGDRFFTTLERRPFAAWLCAGFLANALVVLLCHLENAVQAAWLMPATALVCFFFLGYAALFRSTAAAAVSVAGIVYASFRHTLNAYDETALQPGLVLGFLLPAFYWVLSERLFALWSHRWGGVLDAVREKTSFELRRPETALAPLSAATVLLLLLIERVPSLAPANLVFITIGWFSLAALLLAVSLLFRQRYYRYAGLAVVLLSLGRLFLIDMKEQDPLLRVAAFAVVGAGLLGISLGYYKWMAKMRSDTVPSGDDSAPPAQEGGPHQDGQGGIATGTGNEDPRD